MSRRVRRTQTGVRRAACLRSSPTGDLATRYRTHIVCGALAEHFTPRIRPADLDQKTTPYVRRVAIEIFEIGDAYERSGDDSSVEAERRARWSNALAVVASLLAGTSGVIGLASDSRVVAAILALASAAVGAVLASTRPSARALESQGYADRCWEVSGLARLQLLDIPTATPEEAKQMLERLRELAQDVSRGRLGPRLLPPA